MADFVNPNTLDIVLSESDRPSPWVVISRASAITALAINQRHRRWVTDHVEEMTPAQKSVADAMALVAADDGRMSQLDRRDVTAALALTIMDEINILRAQHALPARTVTQLKSAIRARMGGL